MAVSADAVAAAGSRVRVRIEGEEEECYTLALNGETDPAQGVISVESPLGRAVLGRRPGATATVMAPGRRFGVEILGVDG